MVESRRHIAYFSPLPPTRKGTADYSAGLLLHLTQVEQITLFVAESEQVASELRAAFELEVFAGFR